MYEAGGKMTAGEVRLKEFLKQELLWKQAVDDEYVMQKSLA